MHDTTERTGYRRSGKVAWPQFLVGTLISCAVAAGMAWVLFRVSEAGWYYRVAAPLLASLPVIFAVGYTVMRGRCRNLWAAGTLALAATLVLYLGHYHTHLVSRNGLDALHRLDLLPKFIASQMATDRPGGGAGTGHPPPR